MEFGKVGGGTGRDTRRVKRKKKVTVMKGNVKKKKKKGDQDKDTG